MWHLAPFGKMAGILSDSCDCPGRLRNAVPLDAVPGPLPFDPRKNNQGFAVSSKILSYSNPPEGREYLTSKREFTCVCLYLLHSNIVLSTIAVGYSVMPPHGSVPVRSKRVAKPSSWVPRWFLAALKKAALQKRRCVPHVDRLNRMNSGELVLQAGHRAAQPDR